MTTETPVTISIVGTGTGTGGGVAPTPDGTIAVTPGPGPNLRINVVPPVIAITVRFVHLFLVTFSGFMTVDAIFGVPILIASDIPTMAKAGLAAAGAGLVKDLITVFGRLEGKYPLLSGGI